LDVGGSRVKGITVINRSILLQTVRDAKIFYEKELDGCLEIPSYFEEHINYLRKTILHCDDLIEEFSGNVQIIVEYKEDSE
jgi:hypothetical protein